ncbi:MAG: hypothetical protein JWP35_2918 [Caulobacter sp.]|nr:hypothetical protein [Caulobacter sp.]
MNRTRAWSLSLATLVFGFLTIASPARADTHYIWLKAGADPVADLAACEAGAKKINGNFPDSGLFVANGGRKTDGLAGAMIGQAFINAPYRGGYVRRCMRRLGYGHVPLTAKEAADYAVLRDPDARRAFGERLMAGDGGQRLTLVLAHTPVPPADEPVAAFPFANMTFDPASVSVTAGAVGGGETLLTASARHPRTARLMADFTLDDVLKVTAVSGAAFYEFTGATNEGPSRSYWCGAATAFYLFHKSQETVCIWNDEDGYALMISNGGQPWMAGQFNEISPLLRSEATAPLPLEETGDDLIGPMEIRLICQRVTSRGVELSATASRDGKAVTFWDNDVLFDADGKAVVPIGGRRLILTRDKGKVAATME